MDPRADQYRANALDCEERAKVTSSESQRLLLIDLAQQWRGLAADVEWLDAYIFDGSII